MHIVLLFGGWNTSPATDADTIKMPTASSTVDHQGLVGTVIIISYRITAGYPTES